MSTVDLSRLKAQLLVSGLQQKDNPLFQVINQLINSVEQIQGSLTTKITALSITTTGEQINFPNYAFLGSDNEESESISIPIPGKDGTIGRNGLQGAPGFILDGLVFEEIEPFYLQSGSGVTSHPLLDGSFNNDTVSQSPTRGSLIHGNSTPKWDELVIGAADTIIKSDGSDPTYGKIINANVDDSAAIRLSKLHFEINAQTGTTYTVLAGDRGKLVTHSNAAAIAITLPQAISDFAAGWYYFTENIGVGTVTITPTTSTIDGDASLALTTDQGILIVSDGTNYFTMRGISSGGGGKILQVVFGSTSIGASNNTNTYADTNLTATITPASTANKILIFVNQNGVAKNTGDTAVQMRLLRDAIELIVWTLTDGRTSGTVKNTFSSGCSFLDSPASVAALVYKTQFLSQSNITGTNIQDGGGTSTITLLEVGG